MIKRLLRTLLFGTAVAVSLTAMVRPSAAVAVGNILLIISDDVGKDAAWPSAAWPATTVPRPPQPNLQALANRGITFGNFDAHQECSPTRAAYMTGQHAFRPQNGVALYVSPSRVDLPATAFTLYEAFSKSPAGQRYRTAHIGKLHLYHGSFGLNAPLTQGGIKNFSGPLPGGALNSMYDWQNVTNGKAKRITTYATTFQSDQAIAEINKDKNTPYFITLSYSAPHIEDRGYRRPPNDLHSYDTISFGPVFDRIHFDAALQALDTEVGRVLKAVDYSTTTVIYMGDNGTAGAVKRPPYGPKGCKSTIYQCGLGVPFVVAGRGVGGTVPRIDQRLAADVDLFPTILQLAGISQATTVPANIKIDGRSLVPYFASPTGPVVHLYNYSESFTNGIYTSQAERSMRGGVYKVITRGTKREFYNLIVDPHEPRTC